MHRRTQIGTLAPISALQHQAFVVGDVQVRSYRIRLKAQYPASIISQASSALRRAHPRRSVDNEWLNYCKPNEAEDAMIDRKHDSIQRTVHSNA